MCLCQRDPLIWQRRSYKSYCIANTSLTLAITPLTPLPTVSPSSGKPCLHQVRRLLANSSSSTTPAQWRMFSRIKTFIFEIPKENKKYIRLNQMAVCFQHFHLPINHFTCKHHLQLSSHYIYIWKWPNQPSKPYNLCAQVYFQVEITSMYVGLQWGLGAKVTHKSSDKASCLFTVKKVKPRFLTDLIQSNLVLSTELNS